MKALGVSGSCAIYDVKRTQRGAPGLHMTTPDLPLDLVLHPPEGSSCVTLADRTPAVRGHKGKVLRSSSPLRGCRGGKL